MKGTTNFLARTIGVALLVGVAGSAFAAGRDDAADMKVRTAPLSPPLVDWVVDSKRGAAEVRAALYANSKAPSDKVTVYRPLPVCRLIDTRGTGTGGQIVINGPLLAGSSTNVSTGGFCGLDSSGIAGLSVSFHVQNQTVNNGGFISFLQQDAPLGGVNAVFNVGAEWTAATANISIPNSSGDFKIVIANSNVEVVVDVNGYYEDLNAIDVGTQQFDLTGSSSGQTFQFENTSATGTAITASATGTSGIALRIVDGRVSVAGISTVNGDDAIFVHETDTAGAYPTGTLCNTTTQADWTILDHPMLNNNPNAAIFIQARDATTFPPATPGDGAFQAYYFVSQSGCTSASAVGKWSIRARSGVDFVDQQRFNVLIFTP